MKRKNLSIALVAVLAAAALPAAAADLWIHVRVDEGKQGEQVSINLPVSLIESLAPVVQSKGRASGGLRIDDDEIAVSDLRRAWRELDREGDSTLLTVRDGSSKVRIAKEGGYLLIEADDDGKVEMKLPGAVVEALLAGDGEELDLAGALRALARHGKGELVTVADGDETVRIWIDDREE
jgi:hypothetical protein